jgi:hypothetical protein
MAMCLGVGPPARSTAQVARRKRVCALEHAPLEAKREARPPIRAGAVAARSLRRAPRQWTVDRQPRLENSFRHRPFAENVSQAFEEVLS